MISKKYFIFTAALVFFLLIASSFLMQNGQLRYNGLRFVAEIQNLIFEKRLGRNIGQRDFNNAVAILDQRAKHLQNLSKGNNTLIRSYFLSLHSSFYAALDPDEKQAFIDLLKKLNELYPERYDIKIMLAESLENVSVYDSLSIIETAIHTLGASPDAYRLGIKLAWQIKDIELLKSFCESFYSNQNGGIQFADLDANQTQELGLRRLAVNIIDGDSKIFVENNGIVLGKATTYRFLMPKSINSSGSLSIFLPLIGGMQVSFNSIAFLKSGNKAAFLEQDEFLLFPSEGSIINNTLIIDNIDMPINIDLNFASEPQKFAYDAIDLNLTFIRAPSFSPMVCNSN